MLTPRPPGGLLRLQERGAGRARSEAQRRLRTLLRRPPGALALLGLGLRARSIPAPGSPAARPPFRLAQKLSGANHAEFRKRREREPGGRGRGPKLRSLLQSLPALGDHRDVRAFAEQHGSQREQHGEIDPVYFMPSDDGRWWEPIMPREVFQGARTVA